MICTYHILIIFMSLLNTLLIGIILIALVLMFQFLIFNSLRHSALRLFSLELRGAKNSSQIGSIPTHCLYSLPTSNHSFHCSQAI